MFIEKLELAQRVPAYSLPVSPHCYITIISLAKLRNYHWYITVSQTLDSVWISPVFPFVSSSCSRTQSRHHTACHVSFVFSGL